MKKLLLTGLLVGSFSANAMALQKVKSEDRWMKIAKGVKEDFEKDNLTNYTVEVYSAVLEYLFATDQKELYGKIFIKTFHHERAKSSKSTYYLDHSGEIKVGTLMIIGGIATAIFAPNKNLRFLGGLISFGLCFGLYEDVVENSFKYAIGQQAIDTYDKQITQLRKQIK